MELQIQLQGRRLNKHTWRAVTRWSFWVSDMHPGVCNVARSVKKDALNGTDKTDILLSARAPILFACSAGDHLWLLQVQRQGQEWKWGSQDQSANGTTAATGWSSSCWAMRVRNQLSCCWQHWPGPAPDPSRTQPLAHAGCTDPAKQTHSLM